MTAQQEQLVLNNMKLVYYLMKKYDFDEDCVASGMVGLVRGVQTFDETKGYQLSTYLSKCILNEVYMYFRNCPEIKNHRNKYKYILISLDRTILENSNSTLADVIPDNNPSIEEQLIKKEQYEQMFNSLDKLSEREQRIIKHKFELEGYPKKTQHELAEMFHVSQSYIARIYKDALIKLRKMMEVD